MPETIGPITFEVIIRRGDNADTESLGRIAVPLENGPDGLRTTTKGVEHDIARIFDHIRA